MKFLFPDWGGGGEACIQNVCAKVRRQQTLVDFRVDERTTEMDLPVIIWEDTSMAWINPDGDKWQAVMKLKGL